VARTAIFDSDLHVPSDRPPLLRRWFETRLWLGPRIARVNRKLIEVAQEFRPEMVWIDKGEWVWPRTVRRLQSLGAQIVLHSTDNLRPHSISNYVVRHNTRRIVEICDISLRPT